MTLPCFMAWVMQRLRQLTALAFKDWPIFLVRGSSTVITLVNYLKHFIIYRFSENHFLSVGVATCPPEHAQPCTLGPPLCLFPDSGRGSVFFPKVVFKTRVTQAVFLSLC